MLKRYMADLADQFPDDETKPGHVVRGEPGDATPTYGKTFQLTKRWEYRRLDLTAAEGLLAGAELNTLGADGWELAGVVGDNAGTHYFLKRSKGG